MAKEKQEEQTRQESREEKLRKEMVIEDGQHFVKMKESRK